MYKGFPVSFHMSIDLLPPKNIDFEITVQLQEALEESAVQVASIRLPGVCTV